MRNNGNNRNDSDESEIRVDERRGRVGVGGRATNSLTLSLNYHPNTNFAFLINPTRTSSTLISDYATCIGDIYSLIFY